MRELITETLAIVAINSIQILKIRMNTGDNHASILTQTPSNECPEFGPTKLDSYLIADFPTNRTSVEDMTTAFCIIGFPKCGTSALARFFERSPAIELNKKNENYEAPYFNTANNDIEKEYVEGKINGHKFTAYAYALSSIERIVAENKDVLLVFCVRDSMSALYSWHRMHTKIAQSGENKNHFVNENDEAREFYSNSKVQDYYYRFAEDKLQYAKYIKRSQRKFPDAKFAVVSQSRLASDARGVMTALHNLLGIEADKEYLESLPGSHTSFGDSAKNPSDLSPEICEALQRNDTELMKLIDEMDPKLNLTRRQAVF